MIRFFHLCPKELSLNGESGNLLVLSQRLRWAGIDSETVSFEGGEIEVDSIDAVFIGSGTTAGSLAALEILRGSKSQLSKLKEAGVPFLALGLGWEILGREILSANGERIEGLGIYPVVSHSSKTRASRESFGFFEGILTTGYANHGSDIEILAGEPAILLEIGNGNSSSQQAPAAPSEGIIAGSLWGMRLNGPIMALNPHLADKFLNVICSRKGINYRQESDEARVADEYARRAREELRDRLIR